MEYINNILCLEFSELVPAIMPKTTYDYHMLQGNFVKHGIGGNGRKVFVEYQSIPKKFKDEVVKLYGDPYAYISKQPILQALSHDHKAQEFYQSYILPNGAKLPSSDLDFENKPQINYVARYTENANWLNMFNRLTSDKMTLKRELNISMGTFWETSIDLMKSKKVDLPYSYRRLKEKLNIYKAQGYVSLIETHKFGNAHSAKIIGDVADAFLKELFTLRNKHSDVTLAQEYNKWAISEGLEPVTPEALGYRRKKWYNELLLEREGMGKTYNKLSKQGRRKRSSAPLLLVNSDDNDLDVYFKAPGNAWYRPALYVVIDTYNDYVLGYAIGDTVTKELVKEAYRNANRHVMELTGASYNWHQIQTDHWAIDQKQTTELGQFYKSMAKSTPAGLKNSQTKYIERSFGSVWHTVLKKMFPSNYSGHNIKAKQQLNPDNLKPAYFPPIEDCHRMVGEFIEAMRQTTRKGSEMTRQQEWMYAFDNSEKSQEKLLTEETRLQIYGKPHLKRDGKTLETNRITAAGLTPTLLGKPRIYELSQDIIYEHIGKSVNVIYDEYDLSTVLVTDGKGLRFLAHEYKLLPSAIADYEPGDRERINDLLQEKGTLMPRIQKEIDSRKHILARAKIDAESRIKAGVLTKEIAHRDQRVITAASYGAKNDKEDDEFFDIYADMLKK